MKFLKQLFGERYQENDLIEAYQESGDLGILARIYQPYMELLFAVCYQYFRTEEDARDGVMELFEKLRTELLVHRPVNFQAWLYRVARNYCLMKIRQKVAAGVVENLEAIENMGDDEHVFSVSDAQIDQLRKCMQNLPAHQKESVALFYLENMCYRKIALQTGFALSKVKSYIQNGKRNLKICLEQNEEE